MTNFEMDLFDTKINSYTLEKEESEQCCQHSIIKPACVPVSIISLVIFLIVFFPLFNEDGFDATFIRYDRSGHCTDQCRLAFYYFLRVGHHFRVQLVETIPSVLVFDNSSVTNLSSYDVWKQLLDGAVVSINVASFYWNLRDPAAHPGSWQGNDTFERFIRAAERGVQLRIVQSQPTVAFPQFDSKYLTENGDHYADGVYWAGYATVRSLDMPKLMDGNGVLHAKFWIVDSRHVYIGSANMDWKSLVEVKELGVVIWNCTCIANDLYKIFTIYWRLGVSDAKIPYKWPLNLRTYFNFSHPLKLLSTKDSAFISVCSYYSSINVNAIDTDALLDVTTTQVFWPKLDNAIRATAYRGVNVRLLVSHWKYSRPEMIHFLKSLVEINDGLPRIANHSGKIEVKLFTIPVDPSHEEIPHTLVNHNKYMVTEKIAYFGTSNWAGDYFISTAGVGISFISPTLVNSLSAIFMRDWTSKYAKTLREFLLDKLSP
uniref:PLD phosphodiesterase domain-containing protein n=1 Tax=Elaeophora elaphi TaxID=1147741 RepID=A0A0R3RPZ7_9BILA